MSRTPVTIVIPVWNAVETTSNCLTALRDTLGPDDQVVVVDNGSRDQTPALLALHDWVEVVTNEQNEGFAGGCNAGARRARNPLLVFLNNDTLPTAGWIDGLVAPFADPRVGGTGPMSNVVSGPQLWTDDDYQPLNMADIAEHADSLRRRAGGSTRATQRLVGFCLVVRTSVFAEIGGFDESFGLGGCEDDDLCNRLQSAGWQLLIAEDTFVHHIGHKTFEDNHIDWFALQEDNLAKLRHKLAAGVPLSFVVLCGAEPLPLVATLVGIDETMGAVPYDVVLLIPDRLPLAEVLDGVGGVRVVDVPNLPEERAWQLGHHAAAGLRRATLRAGEAVDVSAVQRLLDIDPRVAVPMAVGTLLVRAKMDRHEFLAELHRILQPRLYLETGVQFGLSLRLAGPGTRAIGVDPQPQIAEPSAGAEVYAMTSDTFFATDPAGLGLSGETPVDLGFVDGMHLFEYALRDFANMARLSHAGTVIVFDDVSPRNHVEASREPNAGDWAGDVWKVEPILRYLRPGMTMTLVDTEPTGVLVAYDLRPADSQLIGECNAQPLSWLDSPVPDAVLTRRHAFAPEQALSAIEAWHHSHSRTAAAGHA